MNAAAYLLEVGEPEKVAIESDEGSITYERLRDRVARAAGAWRSLGVGAGDRVLVLAPDCIGWVVAYLGAMWAGGVAVGLNSRLFERELLVVVGECGARFAWCTPETVELFERCVEAASGGPALVREAEFDVLLESQAPVDAMERDADDPAFWIYTSGTTGLPKGAIHAQRCVLASTDIAAGVLGAADDRFYSSSKLFFAYAQANSLCAGLRSGATVILDREWATPQRVVETAARHQPSAAFIVPTLYLKLLQAGLAPQLRDVRHFVSAGEKLPPAIRSAWLEATGRGIVDGYGTSETNFLMLYDPDGSGVLRPSPRAELTWRDPPASEKPSRLWIRHPSAALGYWQRAQATAECFAPGCFSPGDLFLDAGDGRFEIRGRQDDLLKIAGQWVSVADVDHALMASCREFVQELGTAPVETRDGLGMIAVFAVAKDGPREQAVAALEAAIEALPRQRRPRETYWVDALPRTPTGKLQRNKLLELRSEMNERMLVD